jgi:hypothetical protein
MVGIFESLIPAVFHPNSKKAHEAAIEEAVISNGLLCTVTSAQIARKHVYLGGQTAKRPFQVRLSGFIEDDVVFYKIRASKCSPFHTTWNQVLNGEEVIGYMSLYEPIQVIERGRTGDDIAIPNQTIINLSVELSRTGESLRPGTFGAHLCNNCGEKINDERLRALPQTIYCVACSQLNEGGGNTWKQPA